MRTCREMRIPTVAVYAEPDARAPHVYFADERAAMSGSSPRQAYLDIEQLVEVARAHGADAVHPGYGFLSENPSFAEACERSELTFIGPPAPSMRASCLRPSRPAAERPRLRSAVPTSISSATSPIPDTSRCRCWRTRRARRSHLANGNAPSSAAIKNS